MVRVYIMSRTLQYTYSNLILNSRLDRGNWTDSGCWVVADLQWFLFAILMLRAFPDFSNCHERAMNEQLSNTIESGTQSTVHHLMYYYDAGLACSFDVHWIFPAGVVGSCFGPNRVVHCSVRVKHALDHCISLPWGPIAGQIISLSIERDFIKWWSKFISNCW